VNFGIVIEIPLEGLNTNPKGLLWESPWHCLVPSMPSSPFGGIHPCLQRVAVQFSVPLGTRARTADSTAFAETMGVSWERGSRANDIRDHLPSNFSRATA